MKKKHPGKARVSVKRDLNSIEKSKSVYMKINYPTYQISHVHKTGTSLCWGVFSHVNVSSRFAGTVLFIKYLCDIFKDCTKAFEEKRIKN